MAVYVIVLTISFLVTDKQSEEEPTFILTLYEIPATQLFPEAAFGQQDTPPYELQPAQIQTPLLSSSSSHSHSFTSEPSRYISLPVQF